MRALLLAGLLVAACGGPTAGDATGGAGSAGADVATGAAAYAAQGCTRCHGERGAGGRGGALAPPKGTADQWVSALRGAHREYSANTLPDATARAIYAWLASIR